MKRRNLMIAVVFAAGVGALGGAVAQGYGPEGGPGMRGGMMQGGMGPGGMGPGGQTPMRGMMDPSARVEQRLTRLKGDLKLTAQQEPLWQAFAEKSKAEAAKGAETRRQHMSNDKPMTAPERLAQMQSGMKDRLAAMEGVTDSFNRLYAALSSEQKAAADKHFSGMGRKPQAGGRGGPGPQGGKTPPAPAADAHKH